MAALGEVEVVQLPGLTPYLAGWELQRAAHLAVATGAQAPTIYLLEHESTYTAGRRTHLDEYPTDGTPVLEVDRGGKITWHGPGQLVAYPVIPLREPLDVIEYLRRLEHAVMVICDALGVPAGRIEGRSGVWVGSIYGPPEASRKICAVGARIARGVTMHGLALNCAPDLSAFDRIVPCGIDDASVTSLSVETGRPVSVSEMRPILAETLVESLKPQLGVIR